MYYFNKVVLFQYRYTYGEPVKGTAVVEIQLKPYEYYDSANYTVLRKTVQVCHLLLIHYHRRHHHHFKVNFILRLFQGMDGSFPIA